VNRSRKKRFFATGSVLLQKINHDKFTSPFYRFAFLALFHRVSMPPFRTNAPHAAFLKGSRTTKPWVVARRREMRVDLVDPAHGLISNTQRLTARPGGIYALTSRSIHATYLSNGTHLYPSRIPLLRLLLLLRSAGVLVDRIASFES
jgi:hypothetical protein